MRNPDPEQLAERLARARRLESARANDRLARRRERMEHAKFAADIVQSAEARSLRVQATRTLTLWVLLPVFTAFALWSTAGVHAGAAVMTGAALGTVMWWALWGLEPALLGTVAWIILVRARLASAGGALAPEAIRVMWACLSISVVLNAIGHWPDTLSAQGVGSLLVHSLGPIGAAMTAHLIGIIEVSISSARPSDGAKTLAELSAETDTAQQRQRFEPFDVLDAALGAHSNGNGHHPGVELTVQPGETPDAAHSAVQSGKAERDPADGDATGDADGDATAADRARQARTVRAEQRRDTARDLWNRGLTVAQIADEMNRKRQTVTGYLLDRGLTKHELAARTRDR